MHEQQLPGAHAPSHGTARNAKELMAMPPVRRGPDPKGAQGPAQAQAPRHPTPPMTREEFAARVGAARQAQVAKREEGKQFKNLADYAGYAIQVVELRIDADVPTANGTRTMVRVVDDEGTQYYCGTQAALDNALPIIETLGEGPYPVPVPMFVASRRTHWGGTYWLEIAEWETPAESEAPPPEGEQTPF